MAAGKAGGLMGRPKKKRGSEPGKRFKTIAVRATEAWADWAERGAAHCRMNLSTAVDVSLGEYFRARGFEEPPPPRY
jgi:hypothetical protein